MFLVLFVWFYSRTVNLIISDCNLEIYFVVGFYIQVLIHSTFEINIRPVFIYYMSCL